MQLSVSCVSPLCTREFKACKAAQRAANNEAQPSNAGEFALTDACVVLLSFPMAQPAAGPQLPRPTASHIICLKDTSTEGPSTCDHSQRHAGDLWSFSSHTLVPHRIRGLCNEVELARGKNRRFVSLVLEIKDLCLTSLLWALKQQQHPHW